MSSNGRSISAFVLSLVLIAGLFGCAAGNDIATTESVSQTVAVEAPAMIFLYGEYHSREYIIDLELELWQNYYHEYGMRHLFLEDAYYTAQMLNMWMQAEDDAILDMIFDAHEGSHAASDVYRHFYQTIKETCPETVFHGTDVGHQYSTLGYWYRDYLQEQGLTDTEEYRLTLDNIEQGQIFYEESDQPSVYRENNMAENFAKAFDALDGESVMGIYGSAHVDLFAMNHTGECPCMGRQLRSRYGDMVSCEDLHQRALESAVPRYTETILINGKQYTAEYFGLREISVSFPEYQSMEFWHIVDGYQDFSAGSNTGNTQGQPAYPMLLQAGEAYMILYTHADGSTHTEYHICTGKYSQGELYTYEVSVN